MRSRGVATTRHLAKANGGLFAIGTVFYLGFFLIGHESFVPGLLSKEMFDTLTVPNRPSSVVWLLLSALVAAELSGLVMLFYSSRLFNIFAYKSEAILKSESLRRIMEGGLRNTSLTAGYVTGNIRDDSRELALFASSLMTLPQVATSLIALAIMAVIDATMTCVVLIPMFAIIVMTQSLSGFVERARERSREAASAVTSHIGDMMTCAETVRLTGTASFFVDRLRKLNAARKHAAQRDLLVANSVLSLNNNVTAVGVAIILGLSAGRMSSGAFTIGSFILFVSYLRITSALPRFLGQLISRHRQATVSARRLDALSAKERLLPPALAGEQAAVSDDFHSLEIVSLSATHSAGRGVRDISFSIMKGELVVISGPTGAGKSTLLRALAGLLDVEAAEVLWNGVPVKDPRTVLRPPQTGFCPQAPTMMSGSLKMNLFLGREHEDESVTEALHTAGVKREVQAFADGIETGVGPRGSRLSGGQRQRLAIARTLLSGCQVALLDDPSSSLDRATEHHLWRALASGKHTCVVATNKEAALRCAAYVIVLHDGKVSAQGRYQDLIAESALLRSVCVH